MQKITTLIFTALMVFSINIMADTNFAADSWVKPLDNPAQEQRAQALGRQFKCVVCEGQSIEDSNASMASDMRRVIRDQINQGKSDQEVIAFMRAAYEDTYGDKIFMRPPLRAQTFLLWFGPLIILLCGGIVMYMTSFRKRKDT